MTNRIIFKLKNESGIKIMTPASDSIEQCKKRIKKDHGSNVEYVAVMPKHLIPQSREWRDAWRLDPDRREIYEDLDRCKQLHLDRLRVWRDKKLKELDYNSMRAIEDGDDIELAVIKEKKQALRDLPQQLDYGLCSCIEDLKLPGEDDDDFGFDGESG